MTGENTQIPIQRGGSKLEVNRALSDLDFPVPKAHYLYWQDLDNTTDLKNRFADLKPPLIARGSHDNDWDGYIDILPSFAGLRTFEEVQAAIIKIKKQACSQKVRTHAIDWGQEFSPEVHVLLQEQSPSLIKASMLRHPHIDGQIDMNYVNIVDRLRYRENFSLARKYKNRLWYTNELERRDINDLEAAFEMHEAIEKCGLFDSNWVYQMEIGLKPLAVYQVRPFKRKGPINEFEIPTIDRSFPSITSHLVFGTTPEKGVELPFVIANSHDVEKGILENQAASEAPYGLILVTKGEKSIPANVTLGKLTIAAVRSYLHEYLQHGEYRYLKKATYSSVNNFVFGIESRKIFDYFPEELKVFERSRYWSNGNRGLIVPVKYTDKVKPG